jgi:ATP-dependent Clp protease protease subunit
MQKNPLLQLIRDNLEAPRRVQVKATADAEEATLYVYDAIGGWFGLPAGDFVKELNAMTAPTIHLRINSPGGDVFEARAMATAIREHKSQIIAHVDGVAASAATLLAIAAKETRMADGAFFMIHQAWSIAMGNADDMLRMVDLLEKADAAIAADYMKKTGKPRQQVVDWMAAETWFTAAEAKDAGFVDGVVADGESANASAQWNLGAYSKVPQALRDRKPAQPAQQYDRVAMERRLAMYEKTRIAA